MTDETEQAAQAAATPPDDAAPAAPGAAPTPPPVPPPRKLTLADIIQKTAELKERTRDVYIPELEGTITIRSMNFGEQRAAVASATRQDAKGRTSIDQNELSRQMVARCVIDPNLAEGEAALVDVWSVSTIKLITDEAMRLSGMESMQTEPAGGIGGPAGFFVPPKIGSPPNPSDT